MSTCPIILLADRKDPEIDAIASTLEEGLHDVISMVDSYEDAQLAVAIGGDGTLIQHGRTLSQHGIPLVGVNSGRLGFLAKFDASSLLSQKSTVFSDTRPIVESHLIEVRVNENESQVVMNEVMIAAGHPFRILELGLSIDDIEAPTLRGDGIIMSTPLGSTAHNASVGGPMVDPAAHVFVLTPLAAHSLAVRPIVLDADAHVVVELLQANAGTSLVIDGEVHCKLEKGMQVRMQRSKHVLSIVLNPTNTFWNALVDKLHWAAPPGLHAENNES